VIPEEVEVKEVSSEDIRQNEIAEGVERWSGIIGHTLERLFERQQRVVLEKAGGAKAKKQLGAGTLSVSQIFDETIWNKQLQEDMRPAIVGAVVAAAEQVSQKAAIPISLRDDVTVAAAVVSQIKDAEKIKSLIKDELRVSVRI
jgi:hypothetical protein